MMLRLLTMYQQPRRLQKTPLLLTMHWNRRWYLKFQSCRLIFQNKPNSTGQYTRINPWPLNKENIHLLNLDDYFEVVFSNNFESQVNAF
jgi:hypothetical protein